MKNYIYFLKTRTSSQWSILAAFYVGLLVFTYFDGGNVLFAAAGLAVTMAVSITLAYLVEIYL